MNRRLKTPTPPAISPLLLGLAGLAMLAILVFAFRPMELTGQSAEAQAIARELLATEGVKPSDLQAETSELRQQGRLRWHFLEQRYRVPVDFSWDSFRASFDRRLKRQRMTLRKTQRENTNGVWVMRAEAVYSSALVYRLLLEQPRLAAAVAAGSVAVGVPFPRGSGKIAIVLDDWGYSMRQVPALVSIRAPLTVAVLPSLPHSVEVAKTAHAQGHEVILHMPMEAQDPKAPREAGTLLTSMSSQQVLQDLAVSLSTVPFARGMNNHQGSKATVTPALMEVVLAEAKRRNLYFLDSMVTDQSVCRQVAGRLRLKFARRAVFLDNQSDPASIREMLVRLAVLAGRQGEAIGIGHDRPNTLQVLQAEVPALEQAGYTLVPASELAEVPSGGSKDR